MVYMTSLNFPKQLPSHNIVSLDGVPTSDQCQGGEVENIEEDVGLINATCSQCRAPFVFSYKKNNWVPDNDFENDLLNSNPLDGELME